MSLVALVLDSEALSALAVGRTREVTRRVRALLTVALDRDADVVVPSAVLAELYRGNSTDAAIDSLTRWGGIS